MDLRHSIEYGSSVLKFEASGEVVYFSLSQCVFMFVKCIEKLFFRLIHSVASYIHRELFLAGCQ